MTPHHRDRWKAHYTTRAGVILTAKEAARFDALKLQWDCPGTEVWKRLLKEYAEDEAKA